MLARLPEEHHQLQSTKFTIHKLKKLFGYHTEKMSSKNSATSGDLSSGQDETSHDLTSTNLTTNEDNTKKNSVKPVWNPDANHGNIGAAEYTGCIDVDLLHPILKPGSPCPDCAALNTKGTLSCDTSQVLVRLIGGPLITGTRYIVTCLKCNTCDTRYKAPVPAEIKNAPKYDISCATALAISRYSMGVPMYRTEQHQDMHGIPMKDATQWDLLKKLHEIAAPVYDQALIEQGANGDLIIYDDTPARILENQANQVATHTTAFISVHDEHRTHLFFTGRNHAGNNADTILSKRTNEKQVIAMMDASPSNIPKKLDPELSARFILCYCLTHGRRKFFEIFNFFDKECDFVLGIIGLVYKNDAHCKKERYTPEQRLRYHQEHSRPAMESLYLWLNNQLTFELNEPNSGLGSAVRYMLRHWIPLTTFLRVAGAPLDSSWAERTIKIAIRHRRNSLFYKTRNGAAVGDCLMSLIYTARQNNINPHDYLNALQRYGPQVKVNPSQWRVDQSISALAPRRTVRDTLASYSSH